MTRNVRHSIGEAKAYICLLTRHRFCMPRKSPPSRLLGNSASQIAMSVSAGSDRSMAVEWRRRNEAYKPAFRLCVENLCESIFTGRRRRIRTPRHSEQFAQSCAALPGENICWLDVSTIRFCLSPSQLQLDARNQDGRTRGERPTARRAKTACSAHIWRGQRWKWVEMQSFEQRDLELKAGGFPVNAAVSRVVRMGITRCAVFAFLPTVFPSPPQSNLSKRDFIAKLRRIPI